MLVSISALIAYEHIVTFGQEVDMYWRQKFKISTVVFLANRYLALIYFTILEQIPLLPSLIVYMRFLEEIRMHSSSEHSSSCSATYYSASLANALIYLPWAVFSALRGYALSQNRYLGIIIFILSSVPFGAECYGSYQGVTIYVDPADGCVVNLAGSDTYLSVISPSSEAHDYDSTSVSIIANLITRVPMVAADLIVVAVTWSATYKATREARVLGKQPSITKILFRDGNAYFIILTLLNILHLIFSLISIGSTNLSVHESILILWIPAFTTILVSRFMLNLQAVTHNRAHEQSLTSFGSVQFNHIVGSLGASLPAPGEGYQDDAHDENTGN
ncbi:hypothetical protein C8T65DRAFT_744499 [Cerioporus squamosus]|nr:hypothetical protein C8T65DRAFT_744499 [Cerioporus squamosus]